jgi:undecaprenyl pyrophosphate phosphatase UppP
MRAWAQWLAEYSHEFDPASWIGHAVQAGLLMVLGNLIISLEAGALLAVGVFLHRELSDALRWIALGKHSGRKARDTVLDWLFPVLAVFLTAGLVRYAGTGWAALFWLAVLLVGVLAATVVYWLDKRAEAKRREGGSGANPASAGGEGP